MHNNCFTLQSPDHLPVEAPVLRIFSEEGLAKSGQEGVTRIEYRLSAVDLSKAEESSIEH
jgi:hypothetical protein